MVALVIFRLTIFHVREFIVNSHELHVTNTAFDFEFGENIGMKLSQMVTVGERWDSTKFSRIKWADKNIHMEKHQMNFAIIFGRKFLQTLAACW